MCFSANASFGVSALLLAGGVASVKSVKLNNSIFFAIIPFIFSVQQFLEGMLWLSFSNTHFLNWRTFSEYTFLVFAQVLWPIWVPLSILQLEKNQVKKKLLSGLLGLGIIVAFYIAYCLIVSPVNTIISNHHISYEVNYPHNTSFMIGILYFLPTIVPPFISSLKKMKLLGLGILLSFIISKIFFKDYVVSVWCFFAAIISIIVYIIMKDYSAKKVYQ